MIAYTDLSITQDYRILCFEKEMTPDARPPLPTLTKVDSLEGLHNYIRNFYTVMFPDSPRATDETNIGVELRVKEMTPDVQPPYTPATKVASLTGTMQPGYIRNFVLEMFSGSPHAYEINVGVEVRAGESFQEFSTRVEVCMRRYNDELRSFGVQSEMPPLESL